MRVGQARLRSVAMEDMPEWARVDWRPFQQCRGSEEGRELHS